MKVIGGFYELLLPERTFEYHQDAVALSNGRACIRLMIKNLNIKKCYLPNYTCDAVYYPFDLEGVKYELYSIDENMEPVALPDLSDGEYFYYINYFGVKNGAVAKLYERYGNRLLIDNTHDFFKRRQLDCWSFTSARKYFGVPDGAFLYASGEVSVDQPRFTDYSLSHSVERLKGNQSKGFADFQAYEKSLNSEIYKISIVSEKLLSLVDIEKAIKSRKENFETLSEFLGDKNTLRLDGIAEDDTPFAYPFLPVSDFAKSSLYHLDIFIPTLWEDPLARRESTDFEKRLATNLMPLPVDERYTKEDMKFMAKQILEVFERA